jgi:hypothetical protein
LCCEQALVGIELIVQKPPCPGGVDGVGVTQLAVSSFPCHHDSRSNPTPARGGQADESTPAGPARCPEDGSGDRSLERPASAGGPGDGALDLALDGGEGPPSLGLSGGGPAPGREDPKRALSSDAAESPGAGFYTRVCADG